MADTRTVFDLHKLYKTYFADRPYFIPLEEDRDKQPVTETPGYTITDHNPNPKGKIFYNKNNISYNKIGSYGQSIWFPVSLKIPVKDNDILTIREIEIEACTVAVNLSKVIIKTAVSERKGTIKECFAIDDYRFTIRGFLIGKNRQFPEEQIIALKEAFETTEPITLNGGYPELFMDASCRVVISNLDFPEVQGKGVWIRPFSMLLETDYVEDLIVVD